MGDDIHIGREEIVNLFKKYRLIKRHVPCKPDGWLIVLRYRKKYEMEVLFHRAVNGYPEVWETEFVSFLQKVDQLTGKVQ